MHSHPKDDLDASATCSHWRIQISTIHPTWSRIRADPGSRGKVLLLSPRPPRKTSRYTEPTWLSHLRMAPAPPGPIGPSGRTGSHLLKMPVVIQNHVAIFVEIR